MVAFSKHTLPFNCYEIGHTWTPYCSDAAAGIGIYCFQESLKIYSSVYLLSQLLSGKVPDKKGWSRLLLSILRSSTFLGCNAAGFISWFCICRRLFGRFSFLSSAFLPSFISNFLAILVEQPHRRPALAIYCTNVASETFFKMLVARGLVRPLPHGEVLIFSLTLAALFRWMSVTKKTNNFLYKFFEFVVGKEWRPPHGRCVPRADTKFLPQKHSLCSHRDGCFVNAAKSFLQRFAAGSGFHLAASLVLSIPTLLRKPARFFSVFKQSKHLRFGLFLGSLASLYKAMMCVLRWARDSDSKNHNVAAGLVAGLSLLFYPNTSLVMYLAWKTIETVYHEGIDAKILPNIPGFSIFLYCLSTGILFHAAVLEPHTVKRSYWNFLSRITNNRISEMNRFLLDEFGTESSKMLPNSFPSYEVKHMSKELKQKLSL